MITELDLIKRDIPMFHKGNKTFVDEPCVFFLFLINLINRGSKIDL